MPRTARSDSQRTIFKTLRDALDLLENPLVMARDPIAYIEAKARIFQLFDRADWDTQIFSPWIRNQFGQPKKNLLKALHDEWGRQTRLEVEA